MCFSILIGSSIAMADSGDAEITVEAQGNREALENGSATVTIIEIDEQQSTTAGLDQIIEQAPGVHISALGGVGDFTGVGLRGSTWRQTLVLLDGIPLNPDGSSVVNLSELPPQAFSHIAVYRGFTPTTIPSAAMGGVVALYSKEAEIPIQAHVSSGSWNTHRASLYSSTRHPDKPLTLMTFADVLSTEGNFQYFDDNGTPYNLRDDGRRERLNNDKSQANAQLRVKVGDENRRLSVFNSILHRDEGVSGSIRLPAESARLQTTRNLSSIDGQLRGHLVKGQGQLWHVIRKETFMDINSELGLGAQLNDYESHSLGGMLQTRYSPSAQIITTLSVAPRFETFEIDDQLNRTGTAFYNRLGGMFGLGADLFTAQETIQFSPSFLLSALQYLEGDDRWYLHPSPQMGLRYQPLSWISLKATAGMYFRPPTMTEMYGDRGFVQGNPSLKPETGQQADVGIKLAWDNSLFQVHWDNLYFWNPSADRITLVQNSQLTQMAQNIGSAMVHGAESALRFEIADKFSQQSSLSWTHSENRDSNLQVNGQPLPRVPQLELHLQQSLTLKGVMLSHQWHYTSTNTWDALGWFSSPPRHIHTAFLRKRLSSNGPELELSGHNLTNQITAVARRDGPASQDQGWSVQPIQDYNAFPIAGRQIMLSLRYSPSPSPKDTQ